MQHDINKTEDSLKEVKLLLAKQEELLKSIDTQEMRELKERYPDLDEIIRKETKAVLQEEGILGPEAPHIKSMGIKRRNYI